MSGRPLRMLVMFAVAVLAWGAALYILQLHIRIGPAQQVINIRWAPEANESARRTAEATLKLREGEERETRTWVYSLEDHSREAIRRIVTHPLVEDTNHIDRGALRVLVDAPEIPALLRRVLEADLGPAISLATALFAVAAFWLGRRELLLGGGGGLRAFADLELPVALAFLSIGFAFFSDHGQSVDENIHFDQIVRLASGDWSLNPVLTTLPGFHAMVAAPIWAAGGATTFHVRLVVFLLSLATIGVFHALSVVLQPEHAGTRTLQFALLPILFPQFFFIYTDVTSLLFVLLMMLAAAHRRYRVAGVLGLLSCLVRQNNVIWLAFAMFWSYLRDEGWTWRPLARSLGRYWTFMATGVGFLLFVAVNQGQVALGEDVGSHPLGSLYFTNIFFLLFLSCFLFLPLWWGYRHHILARLRSWWPWLGLLALFPLFWLGFINDHPHNTERGDYFLRNAILIYFSSTPIRKLLFFVPVAVAGFCLAAVPLQRPWRLLYPFTILFLLPEWLVEQRYYLIPLSLFLLAREPSSPWSERLQTVLFLVGSAGLFWIIERSWRWM
jgi:alpha-1,2-glucosyltransferase